jgi:hypothetical protein
LFDLAIWLPGLVFFGLTVWLIRKLWKAAQTENDLEAERLHAAFGPEIEKALAAVPKAIVDHRSIVEGLLGDDAKLLWLHSTPRHAVWGERRQSGDVICVARIEDGKVVQRWSFD